MKSIIFAPSFSSAHCFVGTRFPSPVDGENRQTSSACDPHYWLYHTRDGMRGGMLFLPCLSSKVLLVHHVHSSLLEREDAAYPRLVLDHAEHVVHDGDVDWVLAAH